MAVCPVRWISLFVVQLSLRVILNLLFENLEKRALGAQCGKPLGGDVFKGKGEVGSGAHEERVRQEEGVAPIGVGRTWAGGLGTELSFTEAEKPAIKSFSKFMRKTQTGCKKCSQTRSKLLSHI